MDKGKMRVGMEITWYKCHGGKVIDVLDAKIEAIGKGEKVLVSWQPHREEDRKARWVMPENVEPKKNEQH